MRRRWKVMEEWDREWKEEREEADEVICCSMTHPIW